MPLYAIPKDFLNSFWPSDAIWRQIWVYIGSGNGLLPDGSCRDSDQGTTLRASDLHNARATILNPFNTELL